MAQVNFREAALRHWIDALLLKNQGSLANTGQHLGFSAECGVKAIYRALSLLPSTPDGDIDWSILPQSDKAKYRKHIDIISQTVSIMNASPITAKYLALIPSIGRFSAWSTDQRYWADAEHVQSSAPNIPDWEKAAAEVLFMLDEARKDGIPV
jgi:hypothetical protein